MNSIETFETKVRQQYAERNAPLLLQNVYAIGRHLGLDEETIRSYIYKLAVSGYLHVIEQKVVPNFNKPCNLDEGKMKQCILELKKRGVTNIKPNDVLNEYVVCFGRPDNLESFLRIVRFEKESLLAMTPMFIKKDVQKNLL